MGAAKRYNIKENIGRYVTAEVIYRYPELYVRLIGHENSADFFSDLCIVFKNVQSFMVNEEFVRQLDDGFFSREYPISIIEDSKWLIGISEEIRIHHSDPIHFRIMTDFPIIDVASSGEPIVYILPRGRGEPEDSEIRWIKC